MLEISKVSWRNFLSYSDYDTTIDFTNLGQCLITGEIINDDGYLSDVGEGEPPRRSNGSGKSTIPNAIQWILFGRTMHSQNPGDSVINYYSGKNCYGRIDFKNGDYIVRTRNTDGKNELIYGNEGNEQKFVSETLSVAKNQQLQLNRIFKLDWEIFSGSVFFNQFGRPWMEMADPNRKKALERILKVDRFTYYAKVAKSRCDKLDLNVQGHNRRLELLIRDLEQSKNELINLEQSIIKYDSDKDNKKNRIIENINELRKRRDSLKLPDIDKLTKKWDIMSQIEQIITKLRSKINTINSSISKLETDIMSLEYKIETWKEKHGKICASCEQSIQIDHINNRIEPYYKDVTEKKQSLINLQTELNAIKNKAKEYTIALNDKKPSMTLSQARMINEEYRQFDSEILRLENVSINVSSEINPFIDMRSRIQSKISEYETQIIDLKAEIERAELYNKHYYYTYKAYNDRNKIKSSVFKEYIPYINSRLDHYFDAFGLDIRIKLTDSLGISGNLWNYDFQSGGERKRTDVAFMLAIYDFHEYIYGRQCNILVLDEVDGRLDDDGINSLINIIKNDLSQKVESILIISHRDMMFDTFPKEIKVTRENRCSRLEII